MRCIFCKQESSSSLSVEHIMPESIGSKKRVLAHGVVCDKCNNYFARKIEKPVLSHPSMRNLRAWHQVPSKRGNIPSLRGHIGGTDVAIGFRLGIDGKLEIEPERLRDSEHVTAEFKASLPNGFLFLIEMDPPKREMSRFLCKMELETIAETFVQGEGGPEEVVDASFFDNIRTYARYGNNFSEWPYSQRRIYPETTLMRLPDTNEWVKVGFGCSFFMTKRQETLFVFCFYGIEFVINVEAHPFKDTRSGWRITGISAQWLNDLVAGLSLKVKADLNSTTFTGTSIYMPDWHSTNFTGVARDAQPSSCTLTGYIVRLKADW